MSGTSPGAARKRLYIMVASPLTENIYERIGARYLSGHFEVKVLDCLDWVRRYDSRPAFAELQHADIIRIGSDAEFGAVMAGHRPDFILDFVGRGESTRKVQDECRRHGALFITHHLIPAPVPESAVSARGRLLSRPLETLPRAFGFIKRRLTGQSALPPDIALLAGTKSRNAWVLSASRIIDTATPAYFELQEARASWTDEKRRLADLPEGGYVLFIDDCLPLSFDFIVGGHKPIIEAERYFAMMNGFFDRLEGVLELPIIIAAHPNGREFADYAERFGGRPVHFGATCELSFDCTAALTHYSSAVNYPVMLRKPINTITFDALKAASQGLFADSISDTLGRTIIDLSANRDDEAIRKAILAPVREAAYADYMANYIVNVDNPGTNPFENLVDYLKRL